MVSGDGAEDDRRMRRSGHDPNGGIRSAHADFSAAVDAYRQALDAVVTGDARPVLERFSRRDDLTLANPLGPPRLGRADVEQAGQGAVANFEAGSLRFEPISTILTVGPPRGGT